MSKTAAQVIAIAAAQIDTLDIARSRAIREKNATVAAHATQAARKVARRALAAARESGLLSVEWRRGDFPRVQARAATREALACKASLREALALTVGWADVPDSRGRARL